jgi:hypothetical protein
MIDAAEPVMAGQMMPQQSAGSSKLLLAITLLGGILVVAPLFMLGKITPGFSLLAVILFLPYMVVCWRLMRTPGAKEGPGLAFGIAFTFIWLGFLICAVNFEQRDYLRLAYTAAVVGIHVVLAGLGIAAFRQGTSKKPGWRVMARSIVDPIVYYGIVFFLALGAHIH